MAKQRVKHFEAGGAAYGDVTLDDGTTVNTDDIGPGDPGWGGDIGTDTGGDTDNGISDPGDAEFPSVVDPLTLTPAQQTAQDEGVRKWLVDNGMSASDAATATGTAGFIDKLLSKYSDGKGGVNWLNVAKTLIPAAGGIMALNSNNATNASADRGYQKGIPSLTLSRTKNAIPTDRRPGAGGVSYFSPATFLGERNMAPGPGGGTAGSVTTPPVGGGGGGGGGGIASLPAGSGGGSSRTSAPAPSAGVGDGMWVNGQYLTAKQIKDFYASGGDDRQFAQQAGVRPGQDRELILQARQIAGGGVMAGDNALKHYFAEYQKYNPNGAYANNYSGWVNDIKNGNGGHYDAMMGGTYTGTANTSADSAPGGIYGPGTGHDFNFQQSGTGARGMGDGWTAGAWDGSRPAAATAKPATPSSSDIMAWYQQHQGDANFQQQAQQAMQQYGLNAQQVAAAGVPTGALQQPAAPAAPTDWNRYMQLNPDLGAAGIKDAAAAQQHWQQFGQNENRQFAAGGGISGLPGAAPAQGRFLRGPGDGVSDSIPAVIDGKRPAALADNEFVIPARAVSELGNGSSEAGSRKLYAMLDRIEKTRHSNKNTAKDTRADRHLPA